MRETTLRDSLTKLPSAPRVSANGKQTAEQTLGKVLRAQQSLSCVFNKDRQLPEFSVSRALPMLTRQPFEEAQGTCTTPQLATAI